MNSPSSPNAAERQLILCIDDDDISLRVRKFLLANAGFNVLTANSGEGGFELFKQHPIELVIADHFLSDKTGTEIAKEMKQLKPEVPILIFSGAAEEPDGLEFADAFAAKGEPPEVVLNIIARLLAKLPATEILPAHIGQQR